MVGCEREETLLGGSYDWKRWKMLVTTTGFVGLDLDAVRQAYALLVKLEPKVSVYA